MTVSDHSIFDGDNSKVPMWELTRLRQLHKISSITFTEIETQIEHTLNVGLEIFDLKMGIIGRIDGRKYTIEYVVSKSMDLTVGQTFDLGQTYCDLTISANDVVATSHMGNSS
ncbi:MAG: hypothetical protein PVI90_02750, partial [Desulfobacteraceae bacterium]